MVNSTSPVFKGGEVVGHFLGKAIRYAFLASTFGILARYVTRSRLPNPPVPRP